MQPPFLHFLKNHRFVDIEKKCNHDFFCVLKKLLTLKTFVPPRPPVESRDRSVNVNAMVAHSHLVTPIQQGGAGGQIGSRQIGLKIRLSQGIGDRSQNSPKSGSWLKVLSLVPEAEAMNWPSSVT